MYVIALCNYVSAEYIVFVNAYTVVSWNPRKADVRDSSEGQLFQVPGSEHAKLKQVVQGCVQYNIDCLQGRRVHRLWATGSVFNHSHNKKVFFFYLYGISAFQLVPIAFCPVTGYTRYLGFLVLSSLSPPIKYFSMWLRFLSETPSGWAVPALFFSPPWSLYCLVTLHCTHFSMSVCVLQLGVQDWTQHSRSTSPGLVRGEGSCPSTCWQHF